MSEKIKKKSTKPSSKAVKTAVKKPAAKKSTTKKTPLKSASKQSLKKKKDEAYGNPTAHYAAGDFTLSAQSTPEDASVHLTDIEPTPSQDFSSHIDPQSPISPPPENLQSTHTDQPNIQYAYTKEEGYLEKIATAEQAIVDALAEQSEHLKLVPALSPADLLITEVLKDDAIAPVSITTGGSEGAEQQETAIPSFSEDTPPAIKEPPSPSDTPAQTEAPAVEEGIGSPPSEPVKSIYQTVKVFLTHPSILMLLSAFLFSSMILFVKLASTYYTSFEIISFRGLVGVLCILFFQLFRHGFSGIRSLRTKYLGMQAWRAFVGTTSMLCWFYGVSKLTLAMSTTLNYMSSIWMAIFIISTAFITGKSSPSFKLLGSVLVGFAGIVIVLRPSGANVDMFAAAVVIIASVFGALAYLQVAALGKKGEPAYRTVFYFSAFGAIFGLIATLVYQGTLSEFSWMGLLLLLPIGVLAMLAQFCLTLAYTGGNALVNASLQYAGLIFVVFFDWLLGAGWPDYIAWIGMALVVSSGLLATIARARQKKPSA